MQTLNVIPIRSAGLSPAIVSAIPRKASAPQIAVHGSMATVKLLEETVGNTMAPIRRCAQRQDVNGMARSLVKEVTDGVKKTGIPMQTAGITRQKIHAQAMLHARGQMTRGTARRIQAKMMHGARTMVDGAMLRPSLQARIAGNMTAM